MMPPPKVHRPNPSTITPLTIASLNNGNSIELVGLIGNTKARVLVDGAAQVNACTNRIMKANPNRHIERINKQIFSFDNHVAVPSELAYKSTLSTKIPDLFEGDVSFVEAPIQSHDVILGIPWLETVHPDINWTTKTLQQRQPASKPPITLTKHTNPKNNSFVTAKKTHPPPTDPPANKTTNDSLEITTTENDLTNKIF
ncbi:hypothetical protein K3495_g11923 [Podosphaera aphanis]|nr:hypothetical protein K3495_g11923 [Podosphaera aphanis]